MKNILLVEDDKFLSAVLKNRLEKEGFFVAHAADGEEAIMFLQKAEILPDVILLDIIMPKKNGFEVLEFIKQDKKLHALPVIIISNLGQDSDISQGKRLGALEYYVKAHTSIDNLILKIKKFTNFA